MLIADGYNYNTTGPLTSAEIYNPSTQTFTVTGSEASTGWLGTATLLGNGNVLIAGSVLNSASAELYNPGAGTFSTTSALITPGDLQTATLLPSGAVLIAGGHSNANNSYWRLPNYTIRRRSRLPISRPSRSLPALPR